MKDIIENIAKLIKVKTIVTFTILIVFAVLSLRGNITSENVYSVALMVFAFYFGTQSEKNKKE